MESFIAFVKDFFTGYSSAELMNMLIFGIIFFIPKAGPKFLNILKDYFGFTGAKAQSFIIAILAVITIASMWVTGQLGEVDYTLKTFSSIFLMALIPAKFSYKKLMGK